MDLDELDKLSSQERAAHYRGQAEAALRAAEAASDSGIKVAHLLMADSWERLAEHCAGFDRHRFTDRFFVRARSTSPSKSG